MTYITDKETNDTLCKMNKMFTWRCAYCGFEHNHTKRPTKCSCRNGYVKHIKFLKSKIKGEK